MCGKPIRSEQLAFVRAKFGWLVIKGVYLQCTKLRFISIQIGHRITAIGFRFFLCKSNTKFIDNSYWSSIYPIYLSALSTTEIIKELGIAAKKIRAILDIKKFELNGTVIILEPAVLYSATALLQPYNKSTNGGLISAS